MDQAELTKAIIAITGAVVGPVIGAIVAVTAIWTKEHLESRKASQTWFEQSYIAEGIDRLLGYLRLQEIQLALLSVSQTAEVNDGRFSFDHENISKNVGLNAFPVEALVRIETLLKTRDYVAVISSLPEFIRLIALVDPEKRSRALLSDKIALVRQTYQSLLTIREELLGIKVKRKSDIDQIHKNEHIQAALARLSEEHQKWSDRSGERERLVSMGL